MILEVLWDLYAKGFIQALDRIETRKEKEIELRKMRDRDTRKHNKQKKRKRQPKQELPRLFNEAGDEAQDN
jgi:hypothetical protein